MLGIPVGEFHLELVEAKILHHRKREVHASFHFGFDLLRRAEDVRIVLGEAAHAEQAMQNATALVAINGAEFRQAHGQIAIAAQLRFVDQDVAGAIHGLQLVIGLLDLHQAEHAVLVEIGVAGGLPQVEAHNVRGEYEIVAALEQLLAQPVFHERANQSALGMPKNQAGPGFFLNAEELELRAEFAVIAALGFFEPVQIFVQLLLRVERRCVDALQLRIPFLAFPVGPRNAHQLESLNPLGGRDMRSAAEIDEFAGSVEGNHRLIGLFFDQLALEELLGILIELQGFGLRQELALVLQILGGQFAHLLFDFFEVFRSEGLLAQEFVEKAVIDRRSNAQLHVRVEIHHRGGQQVRRGMPEDVQRVGIFFGENLQLDVLLERTAQIEEQAAVFRGIHGVGENAGLFLCAVSARCRHLGHERGVRKPRRDGLGDVDGRGAPGNVFDAAIGKRYVDLFHGESS